MESSVKRQQYWRLLARICNPGVDVANLVSTRELAEELGWSVRTVQRMAQAGEIPVWKREPRRLIFDRHAVMNALQSQR